MGSFWPGVRAPHRRRDPHTGSHVAGTSGGPFVTATQQPAPPLSPDISVKPIRKLPGRRKPLLVEL